MLPLPAVRSGIVLRCAVIQYCPQSFEFQAKFLRHAEYASLLQGVSPMLKKFPLSILSHHQLQLRHSLLLQLFPFLLF